MTKWRKWFAVVPIVALALTACGEADDTADDPVTEEPEEAVDEDEDADAEEDAEEVERADADLVIWADDTRTPVIQAIGDQFAEEQGITVAVQQLPFGDIRDFLVLTGPAGEGPDIIIGAHDWLGTLVDQRRAGAEVELGDRRGRVPRGVGLDAFTYEGNLYGLPYATGERRAVPQHRARSRAAGGLRGHGADGTRAGRGRRRGPALRPPGRP
jgi:arabinogalactan oligomer / maltooligosaccharide transport system substrate-binding protein